MTEPFRFGAAATVQRQVVGGQRGVVTRRAMPGAERPSPARFIDMHLAAIVMPAKAGIQ